MRSFLLSTWRRVGNVFCSGPAVGWGLVAPVLLAFEAGCVSSEQLAKSILTPPNLQRQPNPMPWAEPWLNTFSGGTDRFKRFSVAVGPPAATLSALELPAGDYGLTFVSSVERKPNGKREFWLKALPRTNWPPACVSAQGTVVVLHGYTSQK